MDELDGMWMTCFGVSMLVHFLLVCIWCIFKNLWWLLLDILGYVCLEAFHYYVAGSLPNQLTLAVAVLECGMRCFLRIYLLFLFFTARVSLQWIEVILVCINMFQLLVLLPLYLVNWYLCRHWRRMQVAMIEGPIANTKFAQETVPLPKDLRLLTLSYLGKPHCMQVIYVQPGGNKLLFTSKGLLSQTKQYAVEGGLPLTTRYRFVAHLIARFPEISHLSRYLTANRR